jgi:2'-5' RNA ligase
MQPRHRLVIALEVGEPARAALATAVDPLVSRYPGVLWVEPRQWSVIACALEAIEPDRADEVDGIVAEAAETNARLTMRLDGGAGFEDGSVLFAGVVHNPALTALREDLVERVTKASLPVDGAAFLPHCVIGFAPGGTRLPGELVRSFRGPMVTWTARRLLVMRTRLRLGGIAREIRSIHELALPAEPQVE